MFPASTTADWENYIDPISIDLDAAEVDIADHETRITAIETISGVVVYDNLSDNDDLPILSTDRIVLVRHSEKQGIVCKFRHVARTNHRDQKLPDWGRQQPAPVTTI